MTIKLSKSRLDFEHLKEIVRYYQAGAVNALFGFGIYALLVYCGLNVYVAQIVSHIAGILFNYFTYSRHVFRDAKPSWPRFLLSYAFNYLVSLGALMLANLVVHSPYMAGIIAILATSIVNYFALKHLVFIGTAK
jgi:putative flippase GtrA